MKVIFLDFDGVVVCLPQERELTFEGRSVHSLNKAAVGRLNALVRSTGADVVISSSWRLHQPIDFLTAYLGRAGFKGKVIGVTPHIAEGDMERGFEIERWLCDHPEVKDYVVLDDDADIGPLPEWRWILVQDGWRNGGLLTHHVVKAFEVLGRKDEGK